VVGTFVYGSERNRRYAPRVLAHTQDWLQVRWIGCSEPAETATEEVKMYKLLGTEIIARGKEADDKAWREKQAELFKQRGIEPITVYRVLGRQDGRIFYESWEFETWQELEEFSAKYSADEGIQKLELERAEQGIVVEGTHESFILTDY